MNLATLRVEGTESALESLRNAMPLSIDAEWKKGAERRNGLTHLASGFSATVGDVNKPVELIGIIRSFLAQCKARSVAFSSLGLEAELAIGFTVGDSEQFVAGVEFSPSDLLSLSECGVTLSIMAYPTSDEANVT